MRRALLYMCAAAAVALGGCDAGFETQSIVLDLRVLGVRNDPPEVVLDVDPMDPSSFDQVTIPPVQVTALVADPGAQRRLSWELTACPPTDSLRCDDPTAPYIPIAFGTIDDPEDVGSEGITGSLRMNPEVLRESVRLDDAAGFGGIRVQIELLVYPDGDDQLTQAVWASKRILYSPRLPAQRVANANPSIVALDVDSVPLEGGRCGTAPPIPAAPGDKLRLSPLVDPAVRETYVLPTYDGGFRTITENLRYSWYATAGKFSSEETGGPIDPFGNEPEIEVDWTAPEEPQQVRFWLVQRDERGGAFFLERCFDVQ